MSLRITKRIVRGGLICLMVGSGIFGVAAFLIGPIQQSSTSGLTSSPTDDSSRSEPAFDDLYTAICATRFTRSEKLRDRCHLEELRRRSRPHRRFRPVVIDVYFHILTTRAGEGTVPEKTIEDQIKVLNDAFAGTIPGGVPTPFQFRLADKHVEKNDEWFEMKYSELNPTQAERDAKRTLNKPGNSTLNIYTARVSGTLGWARWPWQLADRIDGVVVGFSTLPGMQADHKNNLGDVVVHEVGHWLGLFHTSEGGCEPPGDCVEDTSAEATPKIDCQDGVDSCRGQGPDPYWNYMNHTNDRCRFVFSRRQVARMEVIYMKYRA